MLFAGGFVLVLRRCRLNSYLWMLISWIVVAYIASALFINKDTRYTMPYLPALALLTAIGLTQLRQVVVQRVWLTLIVLYALLQYAGLTIGLSERVAGMPASLHWDVGALPITLYTERVHIATPARTEDWQIDPLLAAALADARARGLALPIHLLMVPSMDSFDAQTMTYAKWRDRLPVEVSLVTGILQVDSNSVLLQSDYVVTKSGDLGWEFVLQDAGKLTDQLLDPNSSISPTFELIAQFPLPDHSTALLFRHLAKE
jgi:hypothetical protein